jgi:ATP-dependent Clp protease ATP-binding subunit ClpB
MLGGEVAQHENFANIIHDIALLNSLGVKLVLIHGSRPQIAQRLANAGLKLDVSEKALELLGDAGFDPVYGARPLKRAIQTELENPLAHKILSGDFADGETIKVDSADGSFQFSKGADD